jgi:hypothetical protein
MGRMKVVWIINSELQGGSPRLHRLGLNEQAFVIYRRIRDFLGSRKLSSFDGPCDRTTSEMRGRSSRIQIG